jgi:N-acetylglucosaminyl-diphospho-decaprenol L-rhamnosyltransferase
MMLPVYLVHWNAPAWCRSAVDSVLRSRAIRIDVSVVDNGQEGGQPLREILPAHVRIIPSLHNAGYAGGANIALADWRLRFPTSEFCLLGAHDLHVTEDTLAELVAVGVQHPSYGILAPTLGAPELVPSGFRDRGGIRRAAKPVRSALVQRDWASGTCLMLRRECIEEIGGFDERFHSYVEDVDLCLRATDFGWHVIEVTSATAWGLGSASPDAEALTEANVVRLALKRGGRKCGVLAAARVLAWWVRAFAASRIPWRGPTARRQSDRYARGHARVLRLAMSDLARPTPWSRRLDSTSRVIPQRRS